MADLSKFCRVCLSDLPALSSIESYSLEIPSLTLKEMFFACTQVDASEQEKMCRHCQIRMVKAYEFRMQALKSEHIIQTKMCPEKPKLPEFFEDYPDPELSSEGYDEPMCIEPEVTIVKTEIKEEPMENEDETNIEIHEEGSKTKKGKKGKKAKKPAKKPNELPNCFCCYCLMYIKDFKERRQHIADHVQANGGLECDYCNGRKFPTKYQIFNHMVQVHIKRIKKKYLLSENSFPCTLCAKRFSTEAGLDSHKNRSHKMGNEKKRFICHICAKEFKTKNALKVHIGTVHSQNKVKCDICQRELSSVDSLRDHIRLHTGEKPYKCQVCGKGFAQRSTFRNHLDSHVDEKFYACEICGERFKRQRLVNLHKAVHSDVFNFACHLCDQKFRHKSTLVNHLETHLDPEQRIVVCKECGEPVKNKRLLRVHMRIHRDGYFNCHICQQEFKSNSTLTEHIQVKHMGKKFLCPTCAQPFSDYSALRAHERHVHEGVPRPKTIRKTPDLRVRTHENARRNEMRRLRRIWANTKQNQSSEEADAVETIQPPSIEAPSSSSVHPPSFLPPEHLLPPMFMNFQPNPYQ